ncbi:MAG: hypothetical protein WAM82_23605 [Thermoanaerobaculia bacterium]
MEITPPSARREAANVLRVAAVILLATWVYLANTAAPRSGLAAGGSLIAYQKLFRNLEPREQRMFRALHEGLLEAENIRSASGAWPAPAALAGQGIPPFAADPITSREKYAWTLHQEGNLVNYLGLPAGPQLPAFLLSIQEPTPGAPVDTAPNDEQHHRLANGEVLHVAVWMKAEGAKLSDDLYRQPESTGWTQLLAGSSQASPQ